MQQIFGDTRAQFREARQESEPRFAEIRRQTDERLQQVLTPEQWEQFQQMKEEPAARPWRREGAQGRRRALHARRATSVSRERVARVEIRH